MYYVYILFCGDKKLYVGFSRNLKQRIQQHQNGEVASTKYRQPVCLVYYESYLNQNDAVAREKYLKSGGGRRELKKQHKNLFEHLKYKHR